MKFYNYQKKSGFTLVELLVVISIISLLTTIVAASLQTARAKSRDSYRIASLRQIANALEIYYLNNNERYPFPTGGGWVYSCPTPGANWIKNGVDPNWSTNLISAQPHDPREAGCSGNASPFDSTIPAGTPTGYAYYSLDGKQYALAARLELDTGFDVQSTCQKFVTNGSYLYALCGSPTTSWYPYTYYRDSSYK